MHPFIDLLINRDINLSDLRKSPHCPTDEISKICFKQIDLQILFKKFGPSNQVLKKAQTLLLQSKSINLNKSMSPDLSIAFLINLAEIHSSLFDKNDVPEIIEQAEFLISDSVHESIQRYFQYFKINVSFFRTGNFNQSINQFSKLTTFFNPKTALDLDVAILILTFYAKNGCLQMSKNLLLKLEQPKFSHRKNELSKISFIDAVKRGDLQLSKNIFKQISPESIDLPLKEFIIRMHFLDNKWDKSICERLDFSKILWPWANNFILLHQGETLKSLKIVKNYLQEKTLPIGEAQYLLLFSELANGNINSSRQQLKKYLELNSKHYFAAFYQMYFELINNNLPKASGYFHEVSTACRKFKAEGILDFYLNLAPNITPSQIRIMLENPKEKSTKPTKVLRSKDRPNKMIDQFIIGSSESTLLLKNKIKKYAPLDVPVLILGETGVGKDVVAKNLHSQSNRKKLKFLPINCGAINDSLLQSELFGHVAGAFTGAEKDRVGIFEAAGKGTVFLDEIGEITPKLQIALLRILENNEVRPVGSAEPRLIQCRILFATNAILQQMVNQKKFRKDLFFRINKLTIQVPPLRDRPKDILNLIEHYFSKDREGEQCPLISEKLKDKFSSYHWPGNIRELKNEIEMARILNSEKLEYEVDDFKNLFSKMADVPSKEPSDEPNLPLSDQKDIDLSLALELDKNRSTNIHRMDRIKSLFNSLEKVYRIDLVKILNVTPNTVTNDLKKLIKEGYIEKIKPTPGPRTHYFVLKR
ncbi:MAG: hypothetical protein COA79_20000 [Planctomycetota bacterium]|nr:MAG: hypothetical protein COA79_20000 [Planctomycetota bacterium]